MDRVVSQLLGEVDGLDQGEKLQAYGFNRLIYLLSYQGMMFL